jgi:hypothetical protein
MVRKASENVYLDGPLFEPDMIKKFRGAVYAGIAELADEADDIMAAQIEAGGLVASGRLLRSVDVALVQTGGEIGYARIEPTDTWKGTTAVKRVGTKKTRTKKGKLKSSGIYHVSTSTSTSRPPKIWLSKGTRSGKKLTKGFDIFARTATAVKNLDHNRIVAKYIAEALN